MDRRHIAAALLVTTLWAARVAAQAPSVAGEPTRAGEPIPDDEPIPAGAADSVAGPTPADIPLPEAGGRTVVRGGRAPLSCGAATIGRARVEASHPGSAAEALALVPGIRIVQHGAEGKAHQLFLRGFDAVHGSDVAVSVDGVPLNERLNVHGHGYVDLYGIVPEAVRAIRVQKGPFLPEQGDFATAGSVRFETGLPDALRPGLVRLDASHRGRVRLAAVLAPPDAPPDAFVAGEAVSDPGYGPDREAVRGVAQGAWSWALGRGLRLGVFGSGQGARWQSPGAVRLADWQSGAMGFLDTYGRGGEGVSWRGLAGLVLSRETAGSSLRATAWGGVRGLALADDYTGHLVNGDPGDMRRQSQDGGFAGVSADLLHPVPLAVPFAILAGLGWRFDAATQSEKALDLAGVPWRTDRDLSARVHGAHAYLGLRVRPWSWLEVQPSVRGELLAYRVDDRLNRRAGDRVLGAVLPRLALAFPAHPRVTVFADYGRGFRSPEARSVTAPAAGAVEDAALDRYRGGRPAIALADAAEAGLEVRLPGATVVRVAGFGTWIDREIVFDHVSNTNLEQNATRRLGVEAAASAAPLSWLRLQADATWCDARFVRSGRPVPGSAAWSGRVSAELGRERGVHGGAELAWSGRRALAHGASAAGYALLDLHVGWRAARYDVVLAVENATGARALNGAYHYASWFDRGAPRSAIPVIHYTATRPATARLVFTVFL